MGSLRAVLMMGGARAAGTLAGVLRAKAVAVWLGPEGIGLLGLLSSLQETGAQVADGGLSHSSVRQIARARNAPSRFARLRLALALAVLVLAGTVAVAVWSFRAPLARLATGSDARADMFGLLGVGIALMILYRWQQALLNGTQRVGAVAWLTTAGAVLGAGLGVATIALWGMDGLIWAVLLAPATGLALAPFCNRGDIPQVRSPVRFRLLARHWRVLFRVGLVLMLSAVAVLVTPMIFRIWLARDHGLDVAGLYQAGLLLTTHLTGLVLAAVAADLYPKLCACLSDPGRMTALLSDRTRMHLALGGPLAVALGAGAPWVLEALFSRDFVHAAPLVHWMMAGALFRLAAVPAEMVLMAQARAKAILGLQLLHQGVVLTTGFALWPHLGLPGLGIAYLAGQATHLALLTAWNYRHSGILLAPGPMGLLLVLALLTAAAAIAPWVAPDQTLRIDILCTGLAAVAGLFTLTRLSDRTTKPLIRPTGLRPTLGKRSPQTGT